MDDPLHLGNVITILSTKYGLVTGRIVYRDLNMVRIVSQEASDRALEFPLITDGSRFVPELGVSDIEIIEEQTSDYFVDTLGARVGETLEFFTLDGIEAGPNGVVAEIMKSPTKDSIRLEDGRTLKFRGKGPELPIAVIRVTTATTQAEKETPEALPQEAEPQEKQLDLVALLRAIRPAATIETVPTAERTFPDSMQREALLQDLVADISVKQRTNPRRIRMIEREVDLAIALKNSALLRGADGRSLGPNMKSIRTLNDAVAEGPVPAAIPIVKAAKILNLDSVPPESQFKDTDVFPRSLAQTESDSEMLASIYLSGAAPEFTGGIAAKARGLGFYSYLYDLFDRDGRTLVGATEGSWSEDQDVIRTAELGSPVQGLSAGITVSAEATPAFLLSDVTDRTIRVLRSDQSIHVKSGVRNMVSPSDPTEVAGYVMLPIKAALSLRPPKRSGDLPTALLYSVALDTDNLPTLATTLRDLYSKEADPLHAWSTSDDQVEIAPWLEKILPYAVHPSDSLGPRGPRILAVLDSLGLGSANVSPPVHAVLDNWIRKNQAIWRNLLKERRSAIQAVLDAETDRIFEPISGAESKLFPATSELRAKALQDLIDTFKGRNPSLTSWSMLTASMLTEAQGDGLPLLWSYIQKADGLTTTIDEVNATLALEASQRFTIKSKVVKNAALNALKAAPEISTCAHVGRLETIRNVSDVLNRSRLLRDFIETYQGPRSGDWMTCALCTAGCVCYHEIMELEALAQPSRMDSIQKQILVRFGGERYEGKIVCKNCGQPLQDIDYDDHVEFDDNGKPITSRSVLTDEQMAEVTETRLDTPAALTFASASQRDIADALQVIVDRAGIQMPEEVTRRIVRYTDLYVGARAPPPAAYETQRARAIASASTKIKAATGTDIGSVDVPTYAAVLDQLRVTALTGLVALALQTTTMEVTTPFPLCEFSRGGWPIEPEAPKDGKGAVLYMACVVASIQREITPWRNLSWAGLTKLESRRAAVLKATVSGLSIIVAGDPKTGPLSFTPEVRTELVRAQTDTVAREQQALVSRKDRLTHGFRPEALPKSVSRPGVEKNPLPAVEAAIQAGTVAPGMRLELRNAMQQQALATISGLHEVSQGIKETQAIDSFCCPQPLQSLQAATVGPLGKAYGLLQTSHTRLWQTQAEDMLDSVEPVVDETVYFKLFLRFCYQGPQVGRSHEFSFGHLCRQCGFSIRKPYDQIDFDKEGAEILASQEGPLKIEVTAAAFEALSTAVRRSKRVSVSSKAVGTVPWTEGLSRLVETATAKGPYEPFASALTGILAAPLPEVTNVLGRSQAWGPLAIQYDELKAQITDRVGPLVPKQPGKDAERRARDAVAAFDTFDTLTEDPFVEGPRALLEYWCAKVSAAGRGFGITSVTGAKWFKISQQHNELINKLLTENAAWFAPLPDGARPVLAKVADTLAPFIQTWMNHVRPSPTWTVEEARLTLRTIVFTVWRDAVSTTSWLYEDVTVAAERETIASAISDWTRSLMLHAKVQVFKFSKDRIKQILQQRAELERTSVVKEFEDMKDDDQRAAELMKKAFGIGRWSMGKNLQKYNSDLFEFESEQRLRMGIADAPVDPGLAENQGQGQGQTQDYGLGGAAGPEDGYEVTQEAEGDA
jgi:hypothetical protein